MESEFPCPCLSIYVNILSLPLSSPSLCFPGSYKFYVQKFWLSGKLNESPQLMQTLRQSSDLLKALRQSIIETVGQINTSHCTGGRKLRKGTILDCMRKTFFSGIYRERNFVGQQKITDSHTVPWLLVVCPWTGYSPGHCIIYTDP